MLHVARLLFLPCVAVVHRWSLENVFDLLVAELQRQRLALVRHVSCCFLSVVILILAIRALIDQDLSCSLLEELHFSSTEVKRATILLILL